MDVQMPDGAIVTGVPDDVTQSALLERYNSYQPPTGGSTSTLPPTSNPLYGLVSRAGSLIGEGIEGVARVAEKAGDKLEGVLPLSNLTAEQIANERQLEPLFKFAESTKNWAKGINYEPSTKLADLASNPLNAVPFIVERVISSSPDMAASVVAMPAYVTARTNEILNGRLKNDDKTIADATVADVTTALGGAIMESTLERFATKHLFKGKPLSGKSATTRVAKEVGIQSGTEGAEEAIGYLAETVGTKKGVDGRELGESILEGAIVGGGLGGGVRGTREYLDYRNKKQEASNAITKEDEGIIPPIEDTVQTPDTAEIFYSEEPLPQDVLDQGYKLIDQREEDGQLYYAYTKEEPADKETPETPVETPVEPAVETPVETPATGQLPLAIVNPEGTVIAPPKPVDPNVEAQLAAVEPDVESMIPDYPPPAPKVRTTRTPKAPEVPQVTYGTDEKGNIGVPLDDGGAPFKTREDAKNANKSDMKIVKVEGGFALADKTEQDIASDQARVKNLQAGSQGFLSAHAYIASLGGLNKNEAAELDKDAAKSNIRVGGKYVYSAKGGLSIGQAAEALREAGYTSTEDHNEAVRVLSESINEPVYSMYDADAIAEQQINERLEQEAEEYAQQEANAAKEAELISRENTEAANELVIEKYLPRQQSVFSKTASKPFTGNKDRVLSVSQSVTADWTNVPDVVVVDNMQSEGIPQEVKDYDTQTGTEKNPEGFFYRGKIYLLASQLKTDADIIRVLNHEVLGHYGLRGVFGERLTPILDQLAKARRDLVQERATAYGLDMNNVNDRRQAAEEVLATLAQTRPELGFVKRTIAAIRTWLREHGFKNLKLTDDQIIRDYIIPARNFIENGKKTDKQQLSDIRYSRASDQTNTPEFKKWFGDSKVVDADGKPLVVYRGMTTEVPSVLEPTDFFGSNLFGKGINLTSNPSDASKYASTNVNENLDLTGKASIISDNLGISYQEAKTELTKGGGAVLPVYVSIKKPLTIGVEKISPKEAVLRLALAEIGYTEDADRFVRKFNAANDGVAQFQFALNNKATQIYRQIATLQNKDGLIIQPKVSPKSGGATHYLAFEPTQIKSATGNTGAFDPNNPDIRYSIAPLTKAPTVPSTGSPRLNITNVPIEGTWTAAPQKTSTNFLYNWQDKQIDLKDAQKEIEKTAGKIDDALNAYRKENLYYGRVGDQTEQFLNKELRPLLKEIESKKLTLDEVDKYLQALHAKERNDSIAKRVNGMPDGGSGMRTADAQAYLAGLSPDKAQDLQAISRRVRSIISGTQNIEVAGGLELQSKIDGWNTAWPNYVPLFRDEVDYVNSGSGMYRLKYKVKPALGTG